jgi:hypothetical protein
LLKFNPGANANGSLNGSRFNGIDWKIDGADNNDLWHNINSECDPVPDADPRVVAHVNVERADLGPGEIRVHDAAPTEVPLGCPDVRGHLAPSIGIVVGAVDPRGIHAGAHERRDEVAIVRGFHGQRYHDSHGAVRALRSKDARRFRFQQPFPPKEGPCGRRQTIHRLAASRRKGFDNRFNIRTHAALAAVERRKSERHEGSLERPQVRPAQREVRREIPGTRNECATLNARPPPIIDVTRASIDVGQE